MYVCTRETCDALNRGLCAHIYAYVPECVGSFIQSIGLSRNVLSPLYKAMVLIKFDAVYHVEMNDYADLIRLPRQLRRCGSVVGRRVDSQ